MRRLTLFLIYLISLACLGKEEITWYAYHQPPASILEGEYQGLGFMDQSLDLLIKALPQYEHHKVKVTVNRLVQQLKLKQKACAFGLYKTPQRESFILFSETALMHRNLRVLMHKSTFNRLELPTKIKLEQLFNKHNLTTYIVEGRSYGTAIDAVLEKYPYNVMKRSSSSNYGLYQMLERKRLDFVIDYPSTASYALDSHLLKFDYQLLEIEGLTPFSSSGIGCSKSNWGEKVVADINKALSEIKPKPSYFEALSYWSNQLPDNQAFQHYFNTHMATNKPQL